MHQQSQTNPLLMDFEPSFGWPPFNQIEPQDFIEAYEKAFDQKKSDVSKIINDNSSPTFTNTIEALEISGPLLNKINPIFSGLLSAHTNKELENIANIITPKKSQLHDDIFLDNRLFTRVEEVYKEIEELELTVEQKTLLEKTYQHFIRAGIALDDPQKLRIKEINTTLSLLTLQFRQNVLQEDNNFKMIIDQKEDLSGLPDTVTITARDTAKTLGLENHWVFTLHKPCLIPFLQHSDRRHLREKIFKAYVNRGDNHNQFDNKDIIQKIVTLRYEKARLLGYESYGHYVLEENMAKEPGAVYKLLQKLWDATISIAKKEAEEIQSIINKTAGGFNTEPWDWWYYAEKIRKHRFDVDDNELRPYFRLENVQQGAFAVAEKLFGLSFKKIDNLPTYHDEVQTYEVKEQDGSHLGLLILDYFPRSTKQGGAWMSSYRKQSIREGKFITPIIVNVFNFTKPTANTPSLLDLSEVQTLFHEFGHALHGLMSKITYESLSGTAVPRDFVELPSQIMENWATDPAVLPLYARHYQTQIPIPETLMDKMAKSQYFNQGFKTIEYLAAAFLDMDWHTFPFSSPPDVSSFEQQALANLKLIKEIEVRYRSTHFQHIFSGGYAAGYYSYIWAEVLDADAFFLFKKEDLFSQKIATKFRQEILSKGGSEEAMTLYEKFMGRKPDITALLKRKGLMP